MVLLFFVGAIAHGNHLDVDGGESVAIKTKLFCCPWRNIQEAPRNKRTAIIDAHFGGSAVFDIGDFDDAGQGKRLVSPDHVPRHDFFPDGGVASFKTEKRRFVIPRAGSSFFVLERLIDAHWLVVLAPLRIATRHVAMVATTAGCEHKKVRAANESEVEKWVFPE